MMRRTFLFAVFFICGLSARGQSVREIEDSILRYVRSIEKWDTSREEEYQDDSLRLANYRLLTYMKKTLPKNSASLQYDFKRLNKTRIHVLSSDDKKFRIYCWDVGGSGSSRSFDALMQYEGRTGSVVRILNDDSKLPETGGSGSYYKALVTIPTRNRGNIYMAVNNTIVSNPAGGIEIKAYAVKNGKLNDSIGLFKTTTKTLNSIFFYYDLSMTKTAENYAEPSITKDKQELFIPIVSKEGEVSSKYLVYKFDGDYFVFDKRAK